MAAWARLHVNTGKLHMRQNICAARKPTAQHGKQHFHILVLAGITQEATRKSAVPAMINQGSEGKVVAGCSGVITFS
ncbi:hypothetical protein ASD03_26470 [Ensifer sp. Root127]|jgi:hypothetical protein|nr:hypothetical protein ASD03_26470 [Ensifer sp. Root127]